MHRSSDGASIVQWVRRRVMIHGVEGTAEVQNLCVAGEVVSAAVDANGERFAAFCRDGLLHLGSVAGGSEEPRATPLAAPHQSVLSVAFIPGGDDLLAGTTRGELVRIDTRSLSATRLWAATGAVRQLWVAPDGKRAAAMWDGASPLVLDLVANASLGRLPGVGPHAIEWLSHSEIAVARNVIERWDYAGVTPRAIDFADGITALTVSSDGRRVAAAHGSHVSVIDATSRARVATGRWQGELIKDFAYVPGGYDIVAHAFSDHDVVRLGADLTVGQRLTGPSRYRRVIALADGSVAVAVYGTSLLLMRPGTTVAVPGVENVADLVASPDGRHVALLSQGTLWLAHDLHAGGKLMPCAEESTARALAVMPDGSAVAAAGPDGVTLRCVSKDVAPSYRARRGADLVSVAATDGWLAAGGRAGMVWLWRVGESEPVALFHDHQMRIDALVFDPAGRWLAAGDWGGHVAFFAVPGRDGDHRVEVEEAWGLTVDGALGRQEF